MTELLYTGDDMFTAFMAGVLVGYVVGGAVAFYFMFRS